MARFPSRLILWFKFETVVGMLGIVVTVMWFISIQLFLATAIRTEGTIINIARELDSEAHYTYTPEVQFVDQHGQQYTIRTFVSENEHDHEVGDKLPVLYSPKDSTKVTVGTATEIYVGVFIMSLIVLVITILGGVGLYVLRREVGGTERTS